MPIVVHLGDTIKDYRELSPCWCPQVCLLCGRGPVRHHDVRPCRCLGGERPLWTLRYRCRHCGQVFAILPDLLVPGCRYPAAVRDRAVEAYVTGQATYLAIACEDEEGPAPSTIWRWVFALTKRAPSWLAGARRWLRSMGEPVEAIRFRDDLRALFLARGVRRPGMLEGLLTVEAALVWVGQLRRALRERREGPLPTGFWALGLHVLEHLEGGAIAAGP